MDGRVSNDQIESSAFIPAQKKYQGNVLIIQLSTSPGLWTFSRSARKCLLGIFAVVNKP